MRIIKTFLALLISVVVVSLLRTSDVSAQAFLGTTDQLPDTSQVDTYTYNENASDWKPINKHNDTGYLVVGSGEFKQYALVLAIESDSPNLKVDIKHAAVCGNKTAPDHYTGVDSPAPDSLNPTTTYFFGKTFAPILRPGRTFDDVTQKVEVQRDCANPDRSVNLTGLQELKNVDPVTGNKRYGGWIYVNFGYSGSTSFQNSFRLVAPESSKRPNIGYSSDIVNAMRENKQDGDLLELLGVKDLKIGISLTNTDAPRYSYTNYTLSMSVPCSAVIDENENVNLTFFDLDDTLKDQGDNGVGSFWQGTSTIPSIRFTIYEYDKNLPSIMRKWEVKRDNNGNRIDREIRGGRGALYTVPMGGFKKSSLYRFELKYIYRANAIQFSIGENANISTGVPDNDCSQDPVGFIDSCDLLSDGRTTVIKGWAYDNDAASGNNRPNVKLRVTDNGERTLETNKTYYPQKIENWMDGRFGRDVYDNVYGWEARYTDLNPDGKYKISGTVMDIKGDADKALRINGWNAQYDEDRNIYYPLSDPQIPADCLPEKDVRVSCTIIYNGDEVNTQSNFTLNIRHGSRSDVAEIKLYSVRYNLPGFSTPSSLLTVYGGSGPAIARGASAYTLNSPSGTFSTPRYYSGMNAEVGYLYNSGGKIAGGSTTCETDFTVYIKPYLKIYGGDVWSGADFPGTDDSSSASIYAFANANGVNSNGSSSQLGVTSLLNIKGFYSSSLRTSGFTGVAPKATTFANVGNSYANSAFGGGFGSGAKLKTIDYYTDTRNTSLGSSTLSGNVPASRGRVQYTMPGGSTLSNMTIGRGSQAAVYVNGDLYINGNISYDSSARTGLSDIPFFALIVRGDIYIAPNVTNIDGMIVAQAYRSGGSDVGGRIYTCAAGLRSPYATTTAAIANNCGNKLTVNGSFTAKQIRFLRHVTTYSLAPTREARNSNGAGEVFNFSPELYMAPSPLSNGETNGSEPTKYDAIFSLPPVF